MKKSSIIIAVAIVLALAVYAVRTWGPRERTGDVPVGSSGALHETIVFDLHYRGLDTPDGPLSGATLWEVDRAPGDVTDPFVRAVRKRVSECILVHLPLSPENQVSIIETKDGKPVAFYFDVNRDGKLSDDERFLPVPGTQPASESRYVFITSDFLTPTGDHDGVPARLMLVGEPNESGAVSYRWCPACVLEGEVSLGGEAVQLYLFASGCPLAFTTFGDSSYALVVRSPKGAGDLVRKELSKLIEYRGTFYRAEFQGTYEKGESVRVMLAKDARPVGRVVVTVAGTEPLHARLIRARVTDEADPEVRLNVVGPEWRLPAGRFQVAEGCISYGVQDCNEWTAEFCTGPALTVDGGRTTLIELGKPTSSLEVRDYDRLKDKVQEKPVFARGTKLCLMVRMQGKAGETYPCFSRREAASSRMVTVKQHVALLGPGNKLLWSVDFDPGHG